MRRVTASFRVARRIRASFGLGKIRPRADSKAGSEEMDQVRVEGSVLLAFDRSGLVKLDQLASNAAGFHVQIVVILLAEDQCLPTDPQKPPERLWRGAAAQRAADCSRLRCRSDILVEKLRREEHFGDEPADRSPVASSRDGQLATAHRGQDARIGCGRRVRDALRSACCWSTRTAAAWPSCLSTGSADRFADLRTVTSNSRLCPTRTEWASASLSFAGRSGVVRKSWV